MEESTFRLPLYLPAQAAAETEANLIEWYVSAGDHFEKGQVLAQAESAKATFDFEAPCDGRVIKIHHLEGEAVPFSEPVMEIETADAAMKDWIPPAASAEGPSPLATASAADARFERPVETALLGMGGYLPERVVSNAELVRSFPEISDDYVYQVTGIRERRWAQDGEKPSDMAYRASLEAIRKAGIATREIDAIILSTTTPDVAMPATACILQDRLNLGAIPAFDLNAACSGWLYAVSMAQGMIVSGMATNVLTVGVDMQSRLLDPSDRSTYFIFGDGAGAAIVSAASGGGHPIRRIILGADSKGLRMARREEPGYEVLNGRADVDPWIRLDRQGLFRFAVDSFASIIREAIVATGWTAEETNWVIPHQANSRMLKAAAKRSGVPFDRFYLNVDRVGNTSSASIPLAMVEIEESLRPGDKVILCSVGAGVTTAAIAMEW